MKTNESTEPAALLDEREAARYLGGVSAKHLFNLRKRGELPYVQVGRRIMYSRAALDRWIEEVQVVGSSK